MLPLLANQDAQLVDSTFKLHQHEKSDEGSKVSQLSLQQSVSPTVIAKGCITAIGNLSENVRHLVHSPAHFTYNEAMRYYK